MKRKKSNRVFDELAEAIADFVDQKDAPEVEIWQITGVNPLRIESNEGEDFLSEDDQDCDTTQWVKQYDEDYTIKIGDLAVVLHDGDSWTIADIISDTAVAAGGGGGGGPFQPLDSDLTTIAGLSTTSSGVIATDGSGWFRKSYSALKTALSLTKSDVGLSNVTNDAQLKAADLDTDGTLAANSDTKIPSQKAVKTYADKKQPWFNVMAYGAVGDGVANDTTAIQNAINAANSAGGGKVIFPAGTFNHTGLTIYSHVALVGAGFDATILHITADSAHALHGTDVRQVTLTDIGLTGVASGTSLGSYDGIFLEKTGGVATANVALTNVYLNGFSRHGVNLDDPITSVLSNVRAQTVGGDGFHINTGTSIALIGCYGNSCHQHGYYLNGVEYSDLIGCASDSCGIGYGLISCLNMRLSSCGCEAPTSRADGTHLGYSFKISGGGGITVDTCYSVGNPSIAYWATGSVARVGFLRCREGSPSGSPTASIQVDSGCSAMVFDPLVATAASYTSGTTRLWDTTSINHRSTGTVEARLDRGLNTNFASFILARAGTDRWALQTRNDSTDDIYLQNVGQGLTGWLMENRGTMLNLSLLTSSKQYGGGIGVIHVPDANTVPSSNPSGGMILYVESGVLKVRDSSGAISVLRIPNGSDDDVMQRKSGAWVNRTLAQLWTDIAATARTWAALVTFNAGFVVASGQQAKLPSGTSTAPAITFNNEVLGFIRSTTNTLRVICSSAVAVMQWSSTKTQALLLFEITKGFIRTPAKFDLNAFTGGQQGTLQTDMTTSVLTFQAAAGEGAALVATGFPLPFFADIQDGGIHTSERVIVSAIDTTTDVITMSGRGTRGTTAVAWQVADSAVLIPATDEILMSATGPSVAHIFNLSRALTAFLPPNTTSAGQSAPQNGQSFRVSDQAGGANTYPITVRMLNAPASSLGTIDLANGALEAEYSNFTSGYSTIDKRSKVRPAEMSSALFDHWTDAATGANTTETDLYSDTTPNDQLHSDGDKLKIKYGGIFANNTNTKRLKVKYDGNTVLDSGVLTGTAAGSWEIEVLIIRTAYNTARSIATLHVNGVTPTTVVVTETDIGGMSNSARIIKVTGQNGTASANDIVAKLGTIDYVPVAP